MKALFRRAQARSLMGGVHLRPALSDLDHLLKIEPGNKAAQEERQKVHIRFILCVKYQTNKRGGLVGETSN